MQYSLEQLNKKFDLLPEDIQSAISSSDVDQKIQNIGRQHNLHIDKMGELSDETGLVMLGFTHPSNFIKNIKGRVGVDENMAREITKEINEQIFKPIKNSLMKVHETENTITDDKQSETDEQIPSKEEVLEEIERQPTNYNQTTQIAASSDQGIKSISKDIIESKLSKPFKIPKEETEHKAGETPSTTSGGYKDIDPYREPAE